MPGGSNIIFHIESANIPYDSWLDDFSENRSQSLVNMTSALTNCTGGIPFFWIVLGECVLTTKHLIAVICGIVSIVAWMLNSLPQVVENCKQGIPDEAMSPWLLIFWTIGDTCNMVGCILSKQLILQTIMAGYSIAADVLLIVQFIYCAIKHKNMERLKNGQIQDNYFNNSSSIDSISVRADHRGMVSGAPVFACFFSLWGLSVFGSMSGFGSLFAGLDSGMQAVGRAASRKLLEDGPPPPPLLNGFADIFGYVLGCCSALFYFSARIPQLYKNMSRGTTAGLSIGLFLLAVVGNLTYGLQIFITSVETSFILHHLPWIVGSTGVLTLDFIMMFQFFIYRNKQEAAGSHILVESESSPLLYS